MTENLYDIALRVTDEALGEGTYAEINKHNFDPEVQNAIHRHKRTTDPKTRALIAICDDIFQSINSVGSPVQDYELKILVSNIVLKTLLHPQLDEARPPKAEPESVENKPQLRHVSAARLRNGIEYTLCGLEANWSPAAHNALPADAICRTCEELDC